VKIEQKKLAPVGFLIAFLGAILFSTKAIFVKRAFSDTNADALTLLTLRMIFSLPFYVAAASFISARSSNTKMTGKQWFLTIVTGMLGYYLSSLLDFVGLQYISAGLERLILFLYPTFVVFINALFFHQRLSRNQTVALVLTYIGIAIAYYGELQIDTNNPDFLLGSFLVFLCAITYSLYIVGSGRIIPQVGATKFTAYAMLAATTGIFIHFIATRDIAVLGQDNSYWVYGILLAVVATVVPSFLISNAVKLIGANSVAIISSIGPVSTIIQAHYVLNEPIFPEQIVGTILVVIGVLLLGRDKVK
jgi:drug/metabolite transporter (DMT)-like permease